MKLLWTISLISTLLCPYCIKLQNGKYLVHYNERVYKDNVIEIKDNAITQYNGLDSISGKINWVYDCEFEMKFPSNKIEDSVSGPLKNIYDSWGCPVFELLRISGDTVNFRTTFPLNLHITINKGYFLRLNSQARNKIK
jgi:hypothetical protein